MALAVMRLERDQQGHRYVIVEHPHGGQLRLPRTGRIERLPPRPPSSTAGTCDSPSGACGSWPRPSGSPAPENLTFPQWVRHRRHKLKKRAPGPLAPPVAWAALSAAAQRDLLGAWASLLRKTLRPSVEGHDERQDPSDPSRSARRGVPPAVGPQAGT